MLRDRKRLLLFLPIVALAVGVSLLSYGYWEYRQDVEDTRRLFEAHADSVAAIIEEGAREAAFSTSLLYEVVEDCGSGDADAGAPDEGDSAALLAELRREIGIGPLLRGVVQKDVLYAALQDETGILAVAPSERWISSWGDDAALAEAHSRPGKEGASRLRRAGSADVFERLLPFELPDESVVLLRVGLGASAIVAAKDESGRRFGLLAALVGGVVLLVALLAALLWRRQAKEEEHERALREQAARVQHWEAIGQMAATVAHEVRNPLNTVMMAAQRLQREFEVRPEERAEFGELLGMLQSESGRVNRVVTGFLELGKPLTLDLREVNVRGALEAALLPGRVRAEKEGKRLELDDRFGGAIPLDRERFFQIMGNLIDNALDALPEGGMVRVETAWEDGALRVSVMDDGPGMTQEEARDVMKPFVSLKASGTGLGLPLVSRLVEAHGGAFELRSAPGVGTVARFVIPAQPPGGKASG
jgi:signal transduction histidine kinase